MKNTNNLVGKPDTTEDITSPPEETIAKEHGVTEAVSHSQKNSTNDLDELVAKLAPLAQLEGDTISKLVANIDSLAKLSIDASTEDKKILIDKKDNGSRVG